MCACEGWVGGWPACDRGRRVSSRRRRPPPSSVVRCWVGVVNSYWLASAATAWVGELGLTQPAEVTRPSMLLTELGLRPATIGVRR